MRTIRIQDSDLKRLNNGYSVVVDNVLITFAKESKRYVGGSVQ